MRKKLISVMGIALVLVLLLSLAGCGGKKQTEAPKTEAPKTEAPKTEAPKPAAKTKLTLASGGTAGMYYVHSAAVAQIINQKLPQFEATAVTTAASAENVRLVGSGQATIGMTTPDVALDAYNGKASFEGKPLKNLRSLIPGFPSYMQVVVPANSPIKTMANLKGKRISVGAPGSGNLIEAEWVLNAIGLTFKDIKPLNLSYTETVESFRQNQLDAAMVMSGYPMTALMDLNTKMNIRLLEFPKEFEAKFKAARPQYYITPVKGGVYKGQESDVRIVARFNASVVTAETPEDTVYKIVKLLSESTADLNKIHPEAGLWTLKGASGKDIIPWHPGVLKYLKEIGEVK